MSHKRRRPIDLAEILLFAILVLLIAAFVINWQMGLILAVFIVVLLGGTIWMLNA